MIRSRVLWILWLTAFALGAPGPAAAQAQPKPAAKSATAKATFAGGCFWFMEEAYDPVPGVISTVSGYMGCKTKSPTYEQVSGGRTGHAELRSASGREKEG